MAVLAVRPTASRRGLAAGAPPVPGVP